MTMEKKLSSKPPVFSKSGFPQVARDLIKDPPLHHPEGKEGLIPRPNPEAVIRLADNLRRIIFPGYLEAGSPDPDTLQKKLDLEIQGLYNILVEQIRLSFPHECRLRGRLCKACRDRSHDQTYAFIRSLPVTQTFIHKDIQAAYEGDPAAKSHTEIILSYPGLLAITLYRLAHTLHTLGIPLLPRMLTEYAHSRTGIDIHPGAQIGEHFFIDHGTGVVIGETTIIGNRVRLYQGVTLGALSLPPKAGDLFRNKRRHPTIGDDVIIYANATILGEAVIGAGSVIGGNVWLTESVPPGTKVMMNRPDLIYLKN
jgi:serine O-acetyltransferase